ncbi:hypothetical protein FGADI_12332 [Fusarium gaditjirri]|uniref:Uncharacterized protein n=1 Tax=Fusarium gaditjirri TaxID=282569 RepID=A0A8H4SSC1_9HYPO|nr:hypothetical protein FGADI_12332 [Fusarium gaditjirri]
MGELRVYIVRYRRRRRRCCRSRPSSSPASPRNLSLVDAINQTGHVDQRAPNVVLHTETSLTVNELALFADLVQKMHQVEEGLEVPYEIKHWKGFWEQVLKNWDSTMANADDLPLKPLKDADNRVQNDPAPQQGSAVYMSVFATAHEQLLQPHWKDQTGKFVSPSIVKTDKPIVECLDLAVLRFDRAATNQAKQYNIDGIVNAARRRLMHFARVGTGMAAFIPADGHPPPLLKPELVGDRADQTAEA